jgi:hypothetical protein
VTDIEEITVTIDEPDETRLGLARGYLAEYSADEDIFGGKSHVWFVQLGEYVEQQLALDDELITKAAIYLQPFLDEDWRVECAMYPAGEAVNFIEQGWGGDLRKYVEGFVEAIGRDHLRWQAMLRKAGENARWTL